jgi:putative two-component system response regulator
MTILVADDEEANRKLFSTLLAAEGYRVISVENGEKALDLIKNQAVDLALLDVVMPGQTGFAVCRMAKSSPESRLIPIILVTGLNGASDRVDGATCGADDFLSKPIDRNELLARVHSLLRLKQFTDELDNAESVLSSLALSIEAKDPYTEGHCDRLAKYSVALAEKVRLPEELRRALRRGALVHDIGKLCVPEHILLKPGPLTPEERKIMQQHPMAGVRICSPLRTFRHVLPIIRHHHEKLDGSGYPDGLRGDEIPLTARILQTVDIFDALTTDRPYHKAGSPEQAFSLMHEGAKRGWWDSSLVDELEGLIRGSTVGI